MSKSLNTRKIVSHNSSWVTTSESSDEDKNRFAKKATKKGGKRHRYHKISSQKQVQQIETKKSDRRTEKKYYVDGESWDEFDPKICPAEGVPVAVTVMKKQPEISQWETDNSDVSYTSVSSSESEDLGKQGEGDLEKVKPPVGTGEPLKSCMKKGEGDQQDSKDIDELLDPMKFGYVSLTKKVLKEDYVQTRLRKKRRNIRLTDEFGSILKSTYRSELREGGDVDVPPPSLLLQEMEEDMLGIKTVQDILDSKDLTISQKYKSLGVFEDPWEEDCPEAGQSGCWQWFLYKLQKLYYAQWPSVQHQMGYN